MPSASSRSAEPHADDAARLPCLTTRAPAAATTTAAIVEMLTVCARSPPLPQVSTTGPATCNGGACSSIASARPSTSSSVSPFARRAVTNPASCTGLASPVIASLIAHRVAALSSDSPRNNAVSNKDQLNGVSPVGVVIVPATVGPSSADGQPVAVGTQQRE